MSPAERLRARRLEVLAGHEAVDELLRRLRRLADDEALRLGAANADLVESLRQAARDVERVQEAELANADELLAAEFAVDEYQHEVQRWQLLRDLGGDDGAQTPPPTPPFAWMEGPPR